MNKDKYFFLGLIFFYILVRLVFIATSPYSFYEEEQKPGSLGYDLLTGGLRMPFWGYLDSPHAGGSIFTALAAVPFYLVFGKNYLALKLTALAFSLIAFAVIYLYLFLLYSKKIVLPLFLFFVISTPHYLQKSMVHIGNIVEPILIILITLIFIDKIFRKSQKNPVNLFILGFLCGFGFWVQYIQLTVIILLFLIWFLSDKTFFLKKEFFYFLAFFLIGLLPFIVYNFQYNFASFTSDYFLTTEIFAFSLKNFARRVYLFFTLWLPQSFHLPDFLGFSSQTTSYIFYFLVMGLIFVSLQGRPLFKKGKFSLEFLLFGYLIVSILLICLSGLPIGIVFDKWGTMEVYSHYYVAFLQFFVFILASIGLSKLLTLKKNYKVRTWFIVSFLILVFINGFLKSISFSNFNDYLFRPMHNTCALAYETGLNYAKNLSVFTSFSQKIDKNLRHCYFLGSGAAWNNIIEKNKMRGNIDILKEELKLMSDQEKLIFFHSALRGEPWFKRETSYQVFPKLFKVLEIKDRQLLNEAAKGEI